MGLKDEVTKVLLRNDPVSFVQDPVTKTVGTQMKLFYWEGGK